MASHLQRRNATLIVDDMERASDELLAHLTDLCKLLTQSYVAENAKLILIGSGDVYQRIYKQNPSLDERLIQVSLGAFKHPNDSVTFMLLGFKRLGLWNPWNSQYRDQREKTNDCKEAIWEAADGLPKSLNRLGMDIALRAVGRKGVTSGDIITEAGKLSQEHWVQYAQEFDGVLRYLESNIVAVEVLKYLYSEGIARIHKVPDISNSIQCKAAEVGSNIKIKTAIDGLIALDFLVRTGKSGEIIFVKHPAAAHVLGVAMRNPGRFRPFREFDDHQKALQEAFPLPAGDSVLMAAGDPADGE